MSERPPSPSPYGGILPDAPNPEASIPTPPRGLPTVAAASQAFPVRQVAQELPPRPTAPPRRRRAALVVQVVALVIGLAGTAWTSTDYLRTVWPGAAPRQPVAISDAGTATLAGITVSLVEATDLGAAPSLPGSDWQPPAGFHAWRVVLETTSTNEDISSCDVALVDARGRQFLAATFVDSFVDGYEWTFSCGVLDPDDDTGPQQALLVLVPADADVRTVRIWNITLNPDFIEFGV